MSISSGYLGWFAVLATICAAVFYRTSVSSAVTTSPEFRKFQTLFLSVYLTMVTADWLQGPYVYKLYAEYGFEKGQIGMLFIMGFGSSLLFGTIVGGVADKYGRKANCLLFVILYSLSCITKHFNDYNILMLGRLLGGISTSILMSAFETWMIHEHRSAGFQEGWMTTTFAHITFGSGLSAILAGLVASVLVNSFGYVAPFDASLVLLVIGGGIIATSWRENYGEETSRGAGIVSTSSAMDSFAKAWRLLISSEKVFLLGVIQSCFESAMYIFVFMWTPALESTLKEGDAPLPHGIVFAGFMVCLMIGSKLFEVLVRERSVESMNRWLFVVASASLVMPIIAPSSHTAVLLGFCVFEVCCGIYFPSMGTMRSKHIPEEVRSTVMNVFRVGLNLIVVLTLINIDYLSSDTVFTLCCLLLTLAVVSQNRLFGLSEANASAEERSKAGLDPGEEVDDILASKADVAA